MSPETDNGATDVQKMTAATVNGINGSKNMGIKKPEIRTQKDVKNLEHYDLGSRTSAMLKVQGVRRLFVRIQKSTARLSVSYVYRYSERCPEPAGEGSSADTVSSGAAKPKYRAKSRYRSMGTVSEISLREVRKEAVMLNRKILLEGLREITEQCDRDLKNQGFRKITLNELLNLYIENRNLKDSSVKSYRSVVTGYCVRFANTPVSEINPDDLDLSLHKNTRRYYICILNSIASWGVKRKLIPENPFQGLFETCEGIPVRHRSALGCHNFDNLDIAAGAVRCFLATLEKECREPVFLTWICHLILATRISETYRVIMNVSAMEAIPGSSGFALAIEVKATRRGDSTGFRIPVIPIMKTLIFRLREFYREMPSGSFPKFLRKSIPESYRERMSLHGTRSVFRTVIELMNPPGICLAARELYLSHDIRSAVENSYNRQDYLNDRVRLQEIYGNWILGLLSENARTLISRLASEDVPEDNAEAGMPELV